MMVVETTTLCDHLHKLVGLKSEQQLESLLLLLWRTRKTGLSGSQKSSLKSLLNLSSTGDLYPVLASLRNVIRNCVHKNLEGDDILKLLPHDLPLQLQNMFLVLLQKHRDQWKVELSQEPNVLGLTRFSNNVTCGLSTPLLSLPSSELSGSQQVNLVPCVNRHSLGGQTPITAERNVASFPKLTLHNDANSPEILRVLPRVKSMTWTVENKSSVPINRVAVITLKLQDYTKSLSNETEVTFQLTRDTLEAVLRSMTYINEQLSRLVGSCRLPLHKKQRL